MQWSLLRARRPSGGCPYANRNPGAADAVLGRVFGPAAQLWQESSIHSRLAQDLAPLRTVRQNQDSPELIAADVHNQSPRFGVIRAKLHMRALICTLAFAAISGGE